jgi:diguanylate cyclase (GGDEF)-like protein
VNGTLRVVSIVAAGAAAAYDWRLGMAAVALLGAAWEWLQRRLDEQLALAQLSEALQLSTSVAEACELVPEYVQRLFPACAAEMSSTFAAGETDVLTLQTRKGLDVPLAEAFARRIAVALANLREQEALRARAIRDSLTGLFNRRWMKETLLRCSRSCAHTGVILVDVDHFKGYNDRWGHSGGDALLQHLARLMQRIFREEDVVCRLGGEEFVIVVPEASFEELREGAERLVEESRRMAVHLDGQLLGTITLSAGIALSPHHAATVEELISAADRALYAAKSAGRDRVAIPPHHVLGRDAA